MRKIELKKEHEIKLLEMCDDLFSEYSNFTIKDRNVYYLDENKKEQSINWFELCMLELPRRIAENTLSILTDSTHYKIYESMSKRFLNIHPTYKNAKTKHPIEYLYEEFSKI